MAFLVSLILTAVLGPIVIPPIGPLGPIPIGDDTPHPTVRCDVVVAKNGHDRDSGTVEAPLRTSKRAVHKLRNGQTLCFHEGIYTSKRGLSVNAANATIRPYPGEVATLRGSLRVER